MTTKKPKLFIDDDGHCTFNLARAIHNGKANWALGRDAYIRMSTRTVHAI